MVKSKRDLKDKILKYIEQNKSFKTYEVQDFFKNLTGKVHISTNRLSKYIQATKKVEYNKKTKEWIYKNGEKRKN